MLYFIAYQIHREGQGRESMFHVPFFIFHVTSFIYQINAKRKMHNAQWNINPDLPLNPLPCPFHLKNGGYFGRGKYFAVSRFLKIYYTSGVIK